MIKQWQGVIYVHYELGDEILKTDADHLPDMPYQEIMAYEVAAAVDAIGLRCPLPLLRAKQGLRELVPGDFIRVIATDSGSVRDFYSFAKISGHSLEGFCEADNLYVYLLKKK